MPNWNETAALRYVSSANKEGKGFYGPTIKREPSWRDPVLDDAVQRGAVVVVTSGTQAECGYWKRK